MIASVEGSYRDAVKVSDAMKKMQNGEELTDRELIKTRLFMAKNEYESKGTLGSKIADIVRQAPGGMLDFYGCVAYAAIALWRNVMHFSCEFLPNILILAAFLKRKHKPRSIIQKTPLAKTYEIRYDIMQRILSHVRDNHIPLDRPSQ